MSARILVVDDIETNRRLLEARLSAEYFEVLQAVDGRSCLAVAAAEQPDLILLDVMMPGMDGFETCRRLKADPALRHVPVIMVTALDQRQDRIKGLEAGADEFLTKPVDDVALFARVRSLLRLKTVMDELRLRESAAEPEPKAGAARKGGRIVIAAPDADTAARLTAKLPAPFDTSGYAEPLEALRAAAHAVEPALRRAAPVCARALRRGDAPGADPGRGGRGGPPDHGARAGSGRERRDLPAHRRRRTLRAGAHADSP